MLFIKRFLKNRLRKILRGNPNELDSDSIPDIYIETDKERYYCEIKIGKLTEKDLFQAMRYLNAVHNSIEKYEKKEYSVILIGMNISSQLEEKAKRKRIKIMIIGKDISGVIKICKKCRKAFDSKNSKCIFCNSKEILEIITLEYP